MHPLIRPVALAVALGGLATGLCAEEYCVTCTGPGAKYRCIIGNEAKPAARSERGQLLCITELARSGNHASCSVGAITSTPCDGEQRTVMFPAAPAPEVPATAAVPAPSTPVYAPSTGGSYAPASDAAPGYADVPPDNAPANGPQEGAQEPQPAEPAPPATVGELAKKTVKASGDGLQKAGKAVTDGAQSAGNAVGKAAKKTWDCLTSFFGNC